MAACRDDRPAQEAAAYLRSQKIPVGVTGGLLSGHGPSAGAMKGRYPGIAADRAEAVRA